MQHVRQVVRCCYRQAAAQVFSSHQFTQCARVPKKCPIMNHGFVVRHCSSKNTTQTPQDNSSKADGEKTDVINSDTEKADIHGAKSKRKTDLLNQEAAKVIAGLSEEDKNKLAMYKYEYEVKMALGSKVPMVMEDWQYVLLLEECPTRMARSRQLWFWCRVERQREKEKKEKKERQERHLEILEEREELDEKGEYEYPSKILMRIYESTMNHSYFNNIVHSHQFGPHLIFDIGIQQPGASSFELNKTANQLQMAHGFNKLQRPPFHFKFTGCDMERKEVRSIVGPQTYWPGIHSVPYTITEAHYLDLYPKNELVYLSPDAQEEMQEYEHDKTYIIGCLVDKFCTDKLTLARAKREGIKCVKFPIDKYILWGSGSKSLTLDCCTKILHGLHQGQDWKYAIMKNIPIRHLRKPQYSQKNARSKRDRMQELEGYI